MSGESKDGNKPLGLYYCPNVIDEKTAKKIIEWLDKNVWSPLTIKVDTGRLVQQYGARFDYSTYKLMGDVPPIPDELTSLVNILVETCKNLGVELLNTPNQVIVNSYKPGEGISPHTDWKTFGPVIGCFTLVSSGVMEFSKERKPTYSLMVEPNSLYIMSGEARHDWKHSMPARKIDVVDGERVSRGRRVSVTFRYATEKNICRPLKLLVEDA